MNDSELQQSEHVLDGVTDEWLDSHLATVFSKAHRYLEGFHTSTTELVISTARIQPGYRVVDVGCGAGIPALTIAERVGPEGRVTATDPSPIFLDAIQENARKRGLTNMDFALSSAAGLPFERESFDAATCHMGAMFFEDLQAGLTRMREVLCPGGRAGFVAWGPEGDNSFFGTLANVASRYMPPPDPTPAPAADQPRPTRFAEPGTLSRALTNAGFHDIEEASPMVDLVWPDTSDSLIPMWLELTRLGKRIPATQINGFTDEVRDALAPFSGNGSVRFPARMVVGSGAA